MRKGKSEYAVLLLFSFYLQDYSHTANALAVRLILCHFFQISFSIQTLQLSMNKNSKTTQQPEATTIKQKQNKRKKKHSMLNISQCHAMTHKVIWFASE